MARICFVTTVHSLHDHRFLYKECSGLAEAGHEVFYLVEAEKEQTMQGVHVLPLRRPESRAKRMLFSLMLLWRMLGVRADVYHLCDVELLPAGLLIKLLAGRQVVYDAHEDIAAFMLMKTYLPRPLAYLAKWGVEFFEAMAARHFDAFVHADPGMLDDHPAMPRERKMVFYNVPPLRLFARNPVPWSERKYDVCFLGSMSVTSGTWILLEALSRIRRGGREIRALFIGSPSVRGFEQRVRELGLEGCVEVTGRLPYSQIPDLLDNVRIGLIGLMDLPKFQKNIATKMFEYWAKGLAVVSSDLPPERKFLVPGRHGLLVRPEDPSAFAEAIEGLLADPQRGQRMSEEVRDYIEREGYYAENEQRKLVEFYARILETPR
jgi:glycosyltransferase involved in cell wall biosynthesis